VRIRLKGVNTVRRYRKDGSFALYYYHRASGRALEGEPGTPTFIASYSAAEKAIKDRAKGTIADLIRRFAGPLSPKLETVQIDPSPEFIEMAETTQAEYRRKFKVIDRKWGSAPISAFNESEFRKDVLAWRDGIARRARREADNLVSALARLGSFALDRGEIERNVLDKVRRVYHSDRADKLWLPEHVAAFTKVASAEMQVALMLGMHTGQRQGDLRRLPWSAYDGTRITLRQSKGKKIVSIRCTRALRALLDKMERKSLLIMTTPSGRAWTKRYFNEHWYEASLDAGITDLHFHDLRGTAVTMLAEAGCTIPEIAAITGHSLKHVTHILEVYLSRTRALADAAIIKLDRRLKRLQKGS
jgi:integrase